MKRVKTSLLVGMLLVLSGCATNDITGRKQFNIVPGFLINQTAINQYRTFVASMPPCPDDMVVSRVNRVTQDVIRATQRYYEAIGESDKLKAMQWEVRVLDIEEPNAFAIGPGKIAVFSGMADLAKTDDELAAILGHEIAHVISKHGNERVSHAYVAMAGSVGISILMRRETPALNRAVQTAYGIGVTLGALLPYSRKHETEADEIGIYLAAMAGYDPAAAPLVWKRMEDKYGPTKGVFFSTHPKHEDRYERLETLIPAAREFAETYGTN